MSQTSTPWIWPAWRRSARTVVEPQHGVHTWTVMADPEGGEFCAFTQ